MKKIPSLAFALLSAALLTGCVSAVIEGGAAAGGIYATKPSDLPPADTADQMPAHESWCYKTLGEEVECYSQPQDTPPDRLVNVDPANRYPLTGRAYAEVVAQNRLANAPKEPVKDIPDQGITPPPVQTAPVTPPPAATKACTQAAPATKHKSKKRSKKHKKAAKPAPCGPATSPPSTAASPPPSSPPAISN